MLNVEPDTDAARVDTVDATLAAGGDSKAFERLYRGHVGRVHALVRRMIGDDHAADLTQEVFVRAWTKLGTFRGESAFGTWLYRVAVNLVLTRRAALRADQQRFLEADDLVESLPARPVAMEHRMDFEGALDQLPQGARQIFVLHDVEGYKHEEIAGMLGVTSGTSKAQLHRARMILRRHLHR